MSEYATRVIGEFLTKNGFKPNGSASWTNDKCQVTMHGKREHFFEITSSALPGFEGQEMSFYSQNSSIYWLIGNLTYFDLMPKDYKK